MEQQKLYTEEQVKHTLQSMGEFYLVNEFLKTAQPIELPSDEDEEKSATILTDNIQQHAGFNMGVKWMKEQILKKK